MNDFESWLTGELDSGLGDIKPVAPSLQAFKGRGGARRGRRLTLKAATLAVAALFVTGGVALAAGTVITGTPNPTAWGQQVKSRVEFCEQQTPSGKHGLGQCVSSFARQHGQQQQAAHAQGAGAAGAAHGHKIMPGQTAAPAPVSTSNPSPTAGHPIPKTRR